ncbi:MAG: translesion DNA synthesis-associated protein ImuA [Roseateles asaccharophilus]|uniref:translesion DNA synthesis-associated protein ImuA n=1 Tax=Roseateles asaccharophilus TaxID=582607 RepID=UPI0039199CC2
MNPLEPNSSQAAALPVGERLDLLAPAQNAGVSRQALPPELAENVWRGSELSSGRTAIVPTGFSGLDAELPDGGWPCGCLIEVLQAQPSLLEWRLVGPALRGLVSTVDGRSIVVVGPPKRPHLPGLRHLGVDENRLVWIKAEAPSERLWVTEQLVRANAAAAVLTWLPQARPEQLRRLQVLAQGCEGPVFVFRPLAARHDPSPAPLRLLASTLVDWQLQVHILKRRGAAHELPLTLSSIPGGLHHVLTARTLRPSQLIASKEAPRHAVGSPAHLDFASPTVVPVLDRIVDRAASHR